MFFQNSDRLSLKTLGFQLKFKNNFNVFELYLAAQFEFVIAVFELVCLHNT